MYDVQTEWAHALGDVPVLVAERRPRVGAAPSPLVELYDDTREVTAGLTLHRVGGHFRGQAVAQWTGVPTDVACCSPATPSSRTQTDGR